MDTSKNGSLQLSRTNSKSSFLNSEGDNKDSLETFFAELTGDNPKKPEDNEVIQAIIQESESLIPRRNGSLEMNRRDGNKGDKIEELSKKTSSDEVSSGSIHEMLRKMKEGNKDYDDLTMTEEKMMQIMEEKPTEMMIEKPEKIIKEKPMEIMREKPREIMKRKRLEIEDFEADELPAEFLDFGGRLYDAPTILTKAKELDNIREIGPDGKFVVSNKKLTLEEKRKRYEEIIYHFQSHQDIACLICLDAEAAEDDDIFQCDLCNSALHQSCFGSELLEIDDEDDITAMGDWFCHRCAYLMAHDLPFTEVRCEFCPEIKGPIKRLKQKDDKFWGHITCVNWIPEIYYQLGDSKEDVYITQYWEALSCGRKQLLCCFCGIQYGDCIGCDSKSEPKCEIKFHVICAQVHGLIAIWNDMENAKREDDTEYFMPIYCKNHMAREFSQEQYGHAKQVERKNMAQIDGISYLYHLPSDLENNTKFRFFEESHPKSSRRTKEKDWAPPARSQRRSSTNMRIKKESVSPPQRRSRRFRRNADKENFLEEEEDSGANETYIVKNKDDLSKQFDRFRHVKARKSGGYVDEEEEPRKKSARDRPAKKSVLKERNRSQKEPGKPIKKETMTTEIPVPAPAVEEEKKADDKTYQFKPHLADIMNFWGWVSEKEIKEKIRLFLLTNRLYNKEKQVVEIFKNEALYKLMKIETIERKELFTKFKEFMSERNDGMPRDENSYYVQYEKAAKKAREEAALEREKQKEKEREAAAAKLANSKQSQSKPEMKSQLETTLSSRYLPTIIPSVSKSQVINVGSKSLSKSIVPSTPIQKYLNETTTKPISKTIKSPTENIPSLNSKRDGSNVFDQSKKGDEVYTPKKLKPTPLSDSTSGDGEQTSFLLSSLLGDPSSPRGKEKQGFSSALGGLSSLIKPDHMHFRRGMSWFNQTFNFPDFVSASDRVIMAVLWPKGADMLF